MARQGPDDKLNCIDRHGPVATSEDVAPTVWRYSGLQVVAVASSHAAISDAWLSREELAQQAELLGVDATQAAVS
jgi:hypothetical protein